MSGEYPFIAITPRSTVTRSGNTYKGPIPGSNGSVLKLFVFTGTVGNKILKRQL